MRRGEERAARQAIHQIKAAPLEDPNKWP